MPYGREVRKRRRDRGTAMLELVLVMPVYVICVYFIWMAADLGLTLTEAHMGSRFLAWKAAPLTREKARQTFNSTLSAATVRSAFETRLLGPDGRDAAIAVASWDPATEASATYAYSETGMFGNLDATRESAARQTLASAMPEDSAMLQTAMLGGAAKNGEPIASWTRRRMAVASLGVRRFGSEFFTFTPNSRHTVLLGARTGTSAAGYHSGKRGPAATLRQPSPWLESSGLTHQWHDARAKTEQTED